MPAIDSIDVYIERSLRLFEARPSTTRVSITYGSNKTKKEGKEPKGSTATHFTSFKTYDPVSGTCLTTKTYKTKELSRLLALLGPLGMQLTKTKKTVHQEDSGKKAVEKETVSIKARGIASILANKEFEDEPEVAAAEPVASATPTESKATDSKPKKGKKKGKKR